DRRAARLTAVLFVPARHTALDAPPWTEARAREGIATIVADICRQFDPRSLWPTHPREREPGDADVPAPMLYNGAAGAVWALQRLQDDSLAQVDLDLPAIADSLPTHSLRWIEANASEPASYFLGHSGVLLLAWKYSRSPEVADALYAIVEGNLHNKAQEALWGSPGTLVAALHMLEATGEPRWQALLRHGVDLLWQQMSPARHSEHPDREVFLWVQDLYGKLRHYLGAGHGFAGNLFAVVRGSKWLDAEVVAAFEARALETLDVAALREPGLVQWEPHFDPAMSGYPRKPLVQDCHGAPGIVCRLAGTQSAALQALLREAGELVWHAGPLVKRAGLCHGTDGNGYAFLKLHAMTGEARWLERARAFAMHALRQSDTLALEYGHRVPSLWSGDLGLAVYLSSCLRADPRLPTLDIF
ncbi:MAG: LanC-like protein, partial [Burkholderiaceae bacterium]